MSTSAAQIEDEVKLNINTVLNDRTREAQQLFKRTFTHGLLCNEDNTVLSRSKLIVCIILERKRCWTRADAEILLDKGANDNLIGEAFARQDGIKTEPDTGVQVTLPDAQEHPVAGKFKVRVRVQLCQCLVTCYAIPLVDEFDMTLGESWMLEASGLPGVW